MASPRHRRWFSTFLRYGMAAGDVGRVGSTIHDRSAPFLTDASVLAPMLGPRTRRVRRWCWPRRARPVPRARRVVLGVEGGHRRRGVRRAARPVVLPLASCPAQRGQRPGSGWPVEPLEEVGLTWVWPSPAFGPLRRCATAVALARMHRRLSNPQLVFASTSAVVNGRSTMSRPIRGWAGRSGALAHLIQRAVRIAAVTSPGSVINALCLPGTAPVSRQRAGCLSPAAARRRCPSLPGRRRSVHRRHQVLVMGRAVELRGLGSGDGSKRNCCACGAHRGIWRTGTPRAGALINPLAGGATSGSRSKGREMSGSKHGSRA